MYGFDCPMTVLFIEQFELTNHILAVTPDDVTMSDPIGFSGAQEQFRYRIESEGYRVVKMKIVKPFLLLPVNILIVQTMR